MMTTAVTPAATATVLPLFELPFCGEGITGGGSIMFNDIQ